MNSEFTEMQLVWKKKKLERKKKKLLRLEMNAKHLLEDGAQNIVEERKDMVSMGKHRGSKASGSAHITAPLTPRKYSSKLENDQKLNKWEHMKSKERDVMYDNMLARIKKVVAP